MIQQDEKRETVKQIVSDPKNGNYYEFLRNPLLLSMFIMAFENHPEIPKRKSAFYRNVFDTLYSRHDGITKNSFPREKLTKLQRDDFEETLSIFSYLTLIEGQYSFTYEHLTDVLKRVKSYTEHNFIVDDMIYDLRTSISILVLDGFEYNFPHRSIQEYFTALFISKLPSDKKHKAYEKLSEVLKKSSNDYSFTFWSLCYEMDETVFLSNFLLPQLKSIYQLLDKKQGRELLDSYFEIIKPTFLVGDFENDNGNTVKIFRSSSFQNAILDFGDVYNYEMVWSFPESKNCHIEMMKLMREENSGNLRTTNSKKNRSAFASIENSEAVTNLLMKYGLVELIEKIRDEIAKKIVNWHSAIERKKTNIDDLLG